jgi:hypothetical protein
MKKLVSLLLCVSLLACTMSGCAHDLYVNGKTVTPYGLINADEKDPCVQYKVCVGNIVWACILSETVFVPVIVILWFVYQPVGKKDCGQPITR